MVRDDIRAFLRDPEKFASDAEATRDLWLAGLKFAQQAIAADDTKLSLRPAQVIAWKGIADNRASLILGPPGTGKTFALSWMALGYVEACRAMNRGCRVLLTGFTRNSIVNLLDAVHSRSDGLESGPRLVWLGNSPEHGLRDGVDVISAKEFGGVLNSEHLVVGATGWGLFRAIELGGVAREGPTAPLFDLVCIDEASQMVVSQGLLSLAGLAPNGRLLVAGDDQQLAPVRETHERELDGLRLGASLYGFLKHAGVQVYALDETFRLNPPLAEYPAEVFYEGQYRSAVAPEKQRLQLREDWRDGLEPWQEVCLDPENPICVLLHDGPAHGTNNPFEASVVCTLVRLLRDRMLPEKSAPELEDDYFWADRLAVVTPHRAQNALIRRGLRRDGLGQDCVVETVDRIQGRERDAIIASYTVSDPEFAQMEAGFIFNAERFNVTVTRARTKLILVVSRQLINVAPEDNELFEDAQVLRNYVFESSEVATVGILGLSGSPVPVTLRVRRFEGALPAELPESDVGVEPPPDEETLSPELRELLDTVRRMAANNKFGTAASFNLRKELSLTPAEVRAGLLELFALGFVFIEQRDGKGGEFWSIALKDPVRRPHPCDEAGVREQLPPLLRAMSARGAPYYRKVAQHFLFLDEEGQDLFLPIANALVDDGVLEWGEAHGKRTLGLADTVEDQAEDDRPPLAEVPSEEDFVLLNSLEDLEARRINFGVFESWVRPAELSDLSGLTSVELAPVLRRLRADGWLLNLDDGRIRSRAAELARELRYVKQRFRAGDASKRPFLVRAVKVLFLDRDKPTRDQSLKAAIDDLVSTLDGLPRAKSVLLAVFRMLCELWDVEDPQMAGFQVRGLAAILPAWFGRGKARSFVLTADTGSGKTEAAGLPLIAAAAIDALHEVAGTRAVFVYPRIRLANNQAQRLAGYLAALARQKDMPTLTLGVQNVEVPSRFPPEYTADLWQEASAGRYRFPLFACPEKNCDGELLLTPSESQQTPDALDCTRCGWRFAGWIGSKAKIGKIPPSLFVVTTESVHSWLQSQWRGRVFGDDPTNFAAPRAVVADEIHLYSHIHGAQVGFALRRLLARIRDNSDDPEDRPLAIGMSATLGQPQTIWAELSGESPVESITPDAGERQPNPRSREYFYFVQPEVESRGKDVAGASTTIQSLMCLAHGMRRRTGRRGGYRAIAFLDSIDKLKRLHGDYLDAEKNGRLARLRTWEFGVTPPNTAAQLGCCGHPDTCDRFRDGECWYFAATDVHQEAARGAYQPGDSLEVCDVPIFSGSKGGAEERIRTSDVVFSTSSLEVGFDDPDMSLVYQHYAPLNAASFVQRKGRGGRGADDRPITGVTLSVYSPRDAWFFRRPKRMLDAAHFQVPLNMRNFFVRRGQAIALLLDVAARKYFWTREPAAELGADVFDDAGRLAVEVLGKDIFRDLGVTDIAELWGTVRHHVPGPPKTGFAEWAAAIPEVPTRLFDTINLPTVHVQFEDDQGQPDVREEDIALALFTCAPGAVTRRYGFQVSHWSAPVEHRAPWTAVDYSAEHDYFEPLPGGLTALKAALPSYLHKELGEHVSAKVLRPRALKLTRAGKFFGAGWEAFLGFSESERRFVESDGTDDGALAVNPKSEGSLSGFIICDAVKERGHQIPVPALEPLTTGLYAYRGEGSQEQGTGLRVSRIFWGAETRLIVDRTERKRDEFVLVQTFIHPEHSATGSSDAEVLLHGYQVDTEGIRLRLDSDFLDRFVEEEFERLDGTGEGRWLRGQFFRFLLLSRAPQIGLNRFRAREAAEILVTARAFPDQAKRLAKLLRRWNLPVFRDLLRATFTEHLSQSPLLTEQRLDKLVEAIEPLSEFPAYLSQVIHDCGDDGGFRGYLRSLALHGLAVRIQQTFTTQGAGDPRRVLLYTKLPIQFGERADDIIVICEDGEHGDGTTRTFLDRVDDAFEGLRSGGLSECPNAREDEVLERILYERELTERWSEMNPSSPPEVLAFAEALAVDPTMDSGVLQAALRLLTGVEEIGGERFVYLDLHREVFAVREKLESAMQREPSSWELVGRVVALAQSGDASVEQWARLLGCYTDIDDASQEESLAANARLGDQIYRLSARFCVDGCPACLHTGSPLFPPQMMDATVSRRLLVRLEASLGWGANSIVSQQAGSTTRS